MPRKAYLFIALGLGLLAVLVVVANLYLKHEAMLGQRRHLLCEELKPGMSKEEVLRALGPVGDFTVNEVDWPSDFFALDVSFTDAKLLEKYGHFSLVFIDYKYERAVVPRGSDNPDIICNFYQPTKSPTETPTRIP
jgi:hypothetical protein